MRQTLRLIAVAALAGLYACSGEQDRADTPGARIIRLEGVITEAWSDTIQKEIQAAARDGVETLILELETPGGTIQHSQELGDFIFEQKDITVVAYIRRMAYSGGTMVALACDRIFINRAVGKMGDVAPVDAQGQILGEKLQSPVRDTMLRYAMDRQTGEQRYPEALVQAMVTKEIGVYALTYGKDHEKAGQVVYITDAFLDAMPSARRAMFGDSALVVPAGHLLTMNGISAEKYGFATAVEDEQDVYRALGIPAAQVERRYLSRSQRILVRVDPFTPLMIMGGIVLIFIEVSHPGFGLPGVAGIACFALFFLTKASLYHAHALEVILFTAGLVLLMIEVFVIPGFGVVGATGVLLLFISLVLAFQDFAVPRTPGQMTILASSIFKVLGSLAAAVMMVAVLARYLPSLPVLSRIIHRQDLSEARAAEVSERRVPGLQQMVGRQGVVLTALRPAGLAEFDDVRLDVVAEGEFINKGEQVRIIEIHGNRCVVERCRDA